MSRSGIGALCVLAFSAAAFAQAAKAPDAAKPPTKVEAGKVTVVSVSGPAQKLIAAKGKDKWEPIKAGEVLPENTVIRTGLRAKVVLKFEDRAEVTVKSGTQMGISEFRKAGAASKVRMGLKYVRVRTTIRQEKGPSDLRIATPVATLSVRGSGCDSGFGSSGLVVKSFASDWNLQYGNRRRKVRQGEKHKDPKKLGILATQQDNDPGMLDPFGSTNTEKNKYLHWKGVSGFLQGGGLNPSGFKGIIPGTKPSKLVIPTPTLTPTPTPTPTPDPIPDPIPDPDPDPNGNGNGENGNGYRME